MLIDRLATTQLLTFVFLLLASSTTPASAQGLFTFDELATAAGGSSIHDYGINEYGEVGFQMTRSVSGTALYGVYRTENGIPVLLHESAELIYPEFISLNDQGVVVARSLAAAGGMHAYDGSTPRPFGLPASAIFSGGNINESGSIAFTDHESAQWWSANVRTTDGFNGNLSFGSIDKNWAYYSHPVINDEGSVAILRNKTQALCCVWGPHLRVQIYRPGLPVEAQLLPIAWRSADGSTPSRVGFNNRDNVSFTTGPTTPNGQEGVYIKLIELGNQPAVAVATAAQGYADFRHEETSLNDVNWVAFVADSPLGVRTLFTAPAIYEDPQQRDKPLAVVSVGDVLSGFPLTDIKPITMNALNRAGQVAFIGVLADGSERLYRANPATGLVPSDPMLPGPGECIGMICIPAPPTDDEEWNEVRTYFDPDYAIGYQYDQTGSNPPPYTSVLVPLPLPGGDTDFTIEFDGQSHPIQSSQAFWFSDYTINDVHQFTISGINASERIDATDPEGFVVGITVASGSYSNYEVVMDPIVASPVPAMSAVALFFLSGSLGIIGMSRARADASARVGRDS